MKNIIYYVYDVRTTMDQFYASFAYREDAEQWGERKFGEHAYVSNRKLHRNTLITDQTKGYT